MKVAKRAVFDSIRPIPPPNRAPKARPSIGKSDQAPIGCLWNISSPTTCSGSPIQTYPIFQSTSAPCESLVVSSVHCFRVHPRYARTPLRSLASRRQKRPVFENSTETHPRPGSTGLAPHHRLDTATPIASPDVAAARRHDLIFQALELRFGLDLCRLGPMSAISRQGSPRIHHWQDTPRQIRNR